MNEDDFIGSTILSVEIAEDRKALRFSTSMGEVIAKMDGDCCSNIWVEHIDLPALGFPAKVIEVRDLDLDRREEAGYEVTEFYGCEIKTDKGDMTIDYRNESNGYYGGNIHWPWDRYFYGGVYGQNVSNEEWKKAS